MSKTHDAPAPKPDALDTCLTTATAAAKDLLGDNNTTADATVTMSTSVNKDGQVSKAKFQASVGLAKFVEEPVTEEPSKPSC